MISATRWICVGLVLTACCAKEKPYVKHTPYVNSKPDEELHPVPCYVVRDRPFRYTLRLGVGFRAEERQILEAAIKRWNTATGFTIKLEQGDDKMHANVHVLARTPVCWHPEDLNTYGC